MPVIAHQTRCDDPTQSCDQSHGLRSDSHALVQCAAPRYNPVYNSVMPAWPSHGLEKSPPRHCFHLLHLPHHLSFVIADDLTERSSAFGFQSFQALTCVDWRMSPAVHKMFSKHVISLLQEPRSNMDEINVNLISVQMNPYHTQAQPKWDGKWVLLQSPLQSYENTLAPMLLGKTAGLTDRVVKECLLICKWPSCA